MNIRLKLGLAILGFSIFAPTLFAEEELPSSPQIPPPMSVGPLMSPELHVGDIETKYFNNGDPAGPSVYHTLFHMFSGHPALQNSQKALSLALAFYARNKSGIPRSCGGDLGSDDSTMPRRGESYRDIKLDPIDGIDNQRYIMVVDYTIPHPNDRLFVLDTQTGDVQSSPAAHGFGSNNMEKCPEDMKISCFIRNKGVWVSKCSIPTRFSNGYTENGKPSTDTGHTSRGFYLTDAGYRSGQSTFRRGTPASQGNNALILRGLQGSLNSRATVRDIVFHRASYAEDKCKNSAGCPAIEPSLFESIKDNLGRSLMYIHTIEDQDKTQPGC